MLDTVDASMGVATQVTDAANTTMTCDWDNVSFVKLGLMLSLLRMLLFTIGASLLLRGTVLVT